MKESIIQGKSYAFAVRVVRMYQNLTERKREFVLSKQCLRSGTAVGALVAESIHAQSKADFISKMNIALKEASETLYWLNLLKDTDYLSETEHASLYADAEELAKIIVAIIKTMKNQ